MYEKIIFKLEDGTLEIVLNNPAKMNCIGFLMLHELNKAMDIAEKDTSVRVVVFRGAGEKAFSTGADLKEFESLTDDKAGEWIESGNIVFNKIENLKKPTVAYINGYAIGGGLELALACDFRVGTETAVLCCPELQHGWLPGWGGMTRLRRLLGEARAKEIIMLCEKIPAKEAYNLGLLSKIETQDQTELNKLVNYLKKLKPKAFELAKNVLHDATRTTLASDVQFDVLAMKIAK